MFNRRVVTVLCSLVVCLAMVSQGQPPNVALTGTATSSSTGWGWIPEHAIDGSLDTGTHSETDDPDKWWEVELDQSYVLKEIVVHNRASCCDERIVGVVVIAMDADRNEIYVSEPIATHSAGSIHTFDNDGAGFTDVRYIRLEGGTDFLQIMEVQAIQFWPYAYDPAPADGAVDVTGNTLTWAPADGAVSYNVNLGTDPTALELVQESDAMEYTVDPPFTEGAMYYWRIDAVDAGGAVSEGDLWSFTTLPWEAHFPSPVDGDINVMTEGITLTWTIGKDAILHNVYMGTDQAAVEARDPSTVLRSMSLANTVDLDPLEVDTTYFWAVDEWASSGITYPGPVWSLSTIPTIEISDPNLLAWWKLDEGAGTTVLDWSGHGHHGTLGGDAQWAMDGIEFDGNGDYVDFGTPPELYQPENYTYTAWFKVGTDIQGDSGAQYILCIGSRSDLLFGVEDGVGVDGDLSLHYYDTAPGFHAANAGITEWSADEWHMVAGTRDAEGHKIYVDGALRNSDDNTNLDNYATTRMISLGGRAWTGHQWYEGTLSDVRIYDRALTANEIRLMGSDPLQAWDPQPMDDTTADYGIITMLTWQAGDEAVAHDVYVGTDPNLVAAGDASVYQGRVDVPSYTPAEDFAGSATHYWRIDEINADESITAGTIWNFTVRDQVITSPEAWAEIVLLANPGYFDTDVENGSYDIGAFSGDMTYEFILKSNPDETQASMALAGRLGFGDTTVGLKYEQWNNTGTYGATVFGVADYDYGVATNPGIPTHLVFVSSEDTGTTALYVDGALKGSIDAAITLAGRVGIGRAIREDDSAVDDFDGDIYGVAIFDRALSNGEIKIHADAYLVRGPEDVTAPGDEVVGVPNDGNWPDAETPDLAIDDNTGTKYLHFDGGSVVTGIQVAPMLGSTVVTELTLTSANDDYGRDPTSFELSGSNESIDGPYELIAAGDIVDFAGEDVWPRFTKTETPIEFANTVPYAYYQVVFPTVDRSNNDGLMQIAEIELIGRPSVALFLEDFDSYEAGTDLHGVNGWKGWDNTPGAAADVSDAFASSGANSVDIDGSADLVREFDLTGGMIEFSAMQYIPSGTSGTTYFILLNSYDDGANQDWSIQTTFDLAAGTVGYWGGGAATIVYDEWVKLSYVIDLDNNTVDKYYNGELIETADWDDTGHNTLGAIDLYGNGASSVYYDDITISSL